MSLQILSFSPSYSSGSFSALQNIFQADKKNLKNFVDFPWQIYSKDPQYIPPMRMELLGSRLLGIRGILCSDHPFHQFSKIQYFLAKQNSRIVGRLACCIHSKYNKQYQKKQGRFGFFEVIEDEEVSRKLLDAGINWTRTQGMNQVIGPFNFTQERSLGILVEGFDKLPYTSTSYNKKYYSVFLENYGFQKEKDLLALDLKMPSRENFQETYTRMFRISERAKKKYSVSVRPLRIKKEIHFQEDLEFMRQIYNQAWTDNWGIVPFSREETSELAKLLHSLVDPNIFLLAFVDENPAGIFFALPEPNTLLSKRSKRFDIFRMLQILTQKKKITRFRLWGLGILKEYRRIGVDALLYREAFERIWKHEQYQACEISWVLEDNLYTIQASKSMGAKEYKRWRIYSLDL